LQENAENLTTKKTFPHINSQ